MPDNPYIQYSTYFHFLPWFLFFMHSIFILHVSKSSPSTMNCKWTKHVLNSCLQQTVFKDGHNNRFHPAWSARTLPSCHPEAKPTSLFLNQYGPPPMRKVRRKPCNFWGLVINIPWTSLFSWGCLLLEPSHHVLREPNQSTERPSGSRVSTPSWKWTPSPNWQATQLIPCGVETSQVLPQSCQVSANSCPTYKSVSKINDCCCKPLYSFGVVCYKAIVILLEYSYPH